MSKTILKLTLLTVIFLCFSQNSWSTVDSTQVQALAITPTTCNTDFFSTLTPPTTYIQRTPVQMSFTPTNMCPNINYYIEATYTYEGFGCGSNICCGFVDALITNTGSSLKANPCFSSSTLASPVTFNNQKRWNPTDGTIAFVIYTTGSSDQASFINGYIYIHR